MLNGITEYINEVCGGNETMAAAVFLALVGIGTFILRSAPTAIKRLILSRFTTELVFTNGSYENAEVYSKLNVFIAENFKGTFLRAYKLENVWCSQKKRYQLRISPGYAKHLMFYKRMPVLVIREKVENGSSGTNRVMEETTLQILKRHKALFNRFIDINQDSEDDNRIIIRQWDVQSSSWNQLKSEPKRDINNLALNPETKEKFVSIMEYFIHNEATYRRLNLSYKETYVLYGEPGTGKTSIIKALASLYDFSINIINMSLLSDEHFQKALMAVGRGSIVLLEDFDSCRAVRIRSEEYKSPTSIIDGLTEAQRVDVENYIAPISATGILNALDGVCTLDGCLIFMTTNHLNLIDPAILREGRVDGKIELPAIRSEVVQEYFETLYPTLIGCKDVSYREMKAAEINGIVFKAKDDAERIKTFFQ